MLSVGDRLHEFEAIDNENTTIRSADLIGKKTILCFYPKDNTPGCTAEACSLNSWLQTLLEKGYTVIGVSPDSVTSHAKFIAKYNLGFRLIADTDTSLAQKFGAWGEKSMYGKKYFGILRSTFLIGEDGLITNVIEKVDTKKHFEQVLGLIQK